MENNFLELVRKYKMNKVEAKAWKVATLFIELAHQNFPSYNHIKIKQGDPRKSSLFKHCHKLIHHPELKDSEYRNYILAQLQILKKIEINNGHPLISASCLNGPKAWIRWLIWKKKFDQQQVKPSIIVNEHKENHVFRELENTKQFLETKKQSLQDLLENKNLFRYCSLGNVSPYYLFHPEIQAFILNNRIDLLKEFSIDLKFFRPGMTDKMMFWFSN